MKLINTRLDPPFAGTMQDKKRRALVVSLCLFCYTLGVAQIYNFKDNHKQVLGGLVASHYSWVGGEVGYEQKISKSDFFFNAHTQVMGGRSASIEDYSIRYVNLGVNANVGYDFYEALNMTSFDVKTSFGLGLGYVTRSLEDLKIPIDNKFLYGVDLLVSVDWLVSKRVFVRYANRTNLNINFSPLLFSNVSSFGVVFNF